MKSITEAREKKETIFSTISICEKQVHWWRRLISDILKWVSLDLKGYIATVDIEKAFASFSHSSLLACLKKYGYENDFIKWVEMLLECQESCIINRGNTTKHFELQKGARQGGPISAYLYILRLEILCLVFILI